ncbi:AfsR/SARP family transcriptional regulator [Alkaliphilus pronyensis]|uniref:AfsR/SARP family transcriptional regulator n=1 Tax=Alkaliphilus pronyensis TaxID=1482732 RepID=UPI001A9B257C|nr:BTAD domain-containing putative transcriptional regulator [Alkaliphilus pronyensis]
MNQSNNLKLCNSQKEENKLQIYTLGRFEVIRGNQMLYEKSSRSKKLWELFKYMITYKNKNISLDMIHENVFPDENYENPKNVLKNSVYRLRKILRANQPSDNYNNIILFSDECYKLNSNDIWIDIDCFEELFNRAEELKKGSAHDAVTLYREAIALYTGDYLNGYSNMDWVVPIRSYYKRLYLQCCLGLIALLEEMNNYKEVLKICEEFMTIEPYEEEIHVSFIKALARNGQIKEAIKHYEYCTSGFYRTFGIKPSEKLKQVYDNLKKNTNQNNSNKINIYDTDKTRGAFYCKPQTFKSIVQLENRRNERKGEEVLIGSIVLKVEDCIDSKHLLQIIETIKQLIKDDLRKGDIFTLWMENELLLMLPNLSKSQLQNILSRVVEHIRKILKLEGFSVTYRCLTNTEKTKILQI